MDNNVYRHIEWPESQKYLERKDCFKGLDQDVFVPITYGDK